MDGRGLVLIGAEAGSITGIPRVEDHVLKEKLAPYLGQDDVAPRWDTKRVQVSTSNDVLIIMVAAPQAGDPIYTLRKAFTGQQASRGFHDGTIFTRPSTKSEPANSAVVEMLSRRLLASQPAFDVEVDLGPNDIRHYYYDNKKVEALLERLRLEYLKKLPSALGPAGGNPNASRTPDSVPSPPGGKWLAATHLFEIAEDRTPDQYREEIAAYFAAIPNHLPPVVQGLIASTQPAAQPMMRNNTGRFLEDVEAVVHIEGPVISHLRPEQQLPPKPRPWGPRPRYSYVNMARVPLTKFGEPANRQSRATFRNDGSVTMTLQMSTLRPNQAYSFTHEVDEVLIALDPELRSTRVATRVTARNIDGSVEHEYEQQVAEPVDITEVLLKTLADSLI